MTVSVFGVAMLLANAPLQADVPPVAPLPGQPATSQPAPATVPDAPVPQPVPTPAQVVPPAEPVAAPATSPAVPASAAQTATTSGQAASEEEAVEHHGDDLVDADILVTARRRSSGDPLEKVNVESYKAIQALDKAIVGPVAMGYKKGLPKPVRQGIHNAIDNLQEPVVFVNYLLQFKPGKAVETAARFAINSTLGVFGLFDFAKRKPINLPHRTNGLANTLGYYGVGSGPYFFLPGVGPTTLRDLFGITVDRLLLPRVIGTPFNKLYYTIPVNVLSSIDYRVAFDDKLTVLHTATDPYAATREDYLRRRRSEIAALHSAAWRKRNTPPPVVIDTATLPAPFVTLDGTTPAPGAGPVVEPAPVSSPAPTAAQPTPTPAP